MLTCKKTRLDTQPIDAAIAEQGLYRAHNVLVTLITDDDDDDDILHTWHGQMVGRTDG